MRERGTARQVWGSLGGALPQPLYVAGGPRLLGPTAGEGGCT
jgi:hypothetical protein